MLKKVLQKTLGTKRSSGWLLPSTKPVASVGGASHCPFKSVALVSLSHALGSPPRGLQMTTAEQGGGKGWRSSALSLPAQPPASWRTSERTFVWAAKLNLPPSCQGIGKAVRGEEKGESGGRSSGREGRREAGEQALGAPALRHCRPWKLAAPRRAQPGLRTPQQGPSCQASGVPHLVPGALGPRPGSGPRSVSRWRGEVLRKAEEEKVFGR